MLKPTHSFTDGEISRNPERVTMKLSMQLHSKPWANTRKPFDRFTRVRDPDPFSIVFVKFYIYCL